MGLLAALWAGVSYAYPADLPNRLNRCTENSGSLNVSHQECQGLAYFFDETSGVNWTDNENWFSTTDLTNWAHPNGYSTGALIVSGWHLIEMNLNEGNLSGTVTTGLIYLPYLRTLNLANATLGTINLSQNTGLTYLNMTNTSVSGVNITMLTGLKQFYVSSARLLSLNLTQNINLTGLTVNYTPMSYFDLSRNTGLQVLELSFNALTGLDVSNMASLTWLSAIDQSGANMRYTNFSGATSIYRLWLTNVGLTGINVLPIGGALSILQIDGNDITSISLTGSTSVWYVNLGGNSISSLDLSQNPYLSSLFLGNGNTGLTYLDLSYSSWLQILDTSGIVLTGFKISTTFNYLPNLITYFTGNAFDVATLTMDQLRFLNHYMPGWGYRGIGGGKKIAIAKDNCPNGDNSPTPYDGLCNGMSSGGVNNTSAITTGANTTPASIWTQNNSSSNGETPVLTTDTDVYNRAYAHGITTMSLAKVRLHDTIQRYEAAKMIVNFVKNVEGKTITPNANCKIETFSDYTTFDAEMRTYIKGICDLGLMGWKPGKTAMIPIFRPFDTLSAQEFGIVIGRYLGESATSPDSSKRVDIMRFLGSVTTQ